MTDSKRRWLERELQHEEKELDVLTEAMVPHLRRRDELKRELAHDTDEAHVDGVPVVEVDDEIIAPEDLPRW